MTEPSTLDELLDAIHEALAATQELPVERSAARWIGEAEAVARDLANADLSEPVVAERLGHVESLLSEVEATGDERADELLDRAKSLTEAALEALASE
ncbi:hypothetical protein GCM10028857_06380 [Salinarchaeum chitinilyticum]